MVVALCERREYKTLVEYPYDDLHNEVGFNLFVELILD